ncbi:MAG: hypothetical protein ACI9QD_000520 [Thermoproteota archaeon]|jgi:hypothetical protein
MSSKLNLCENPKFWDVLKALTELNFRIEQKEFCHNLELSKDMLNSFLSFLNQVDYPIRLEEVDKKSWVVPPSEKPVFSFNFTMIEWLAFQAHFPVISELQGKEFNNILVDKLIDIESKYQGSDLFAPLTVLDALQDHTIKHGLVLAEEHTIEKEYCSLIEECILKDKAIIIKLANNKLEVFPRRLVHLDGELSIIGEDIYDSCLTQINLNEVNSIYPIDTQHSKTFSHLEITDFINSIRAISENEVRLILKVFDISTVNLTPEHLHMGNPCMVMNSKGDQIWAASVEPCEALFDWLFQLGKAIEIIDPTSIKKQYLDYCMKELKDVA